MLRKMTPSEQDPPAVAAAEPPRAGGQVVAVAVALLEAAALIAAMRRVASWNPRLPLYAAADRLWTASASEDQEDWRTDPRTRPTCAWRPRACSAHPGRSGALELDSLVSVFRLAK